MAKVPGGGKEMLYKPERRRSGRCRCPPRAKWSLDCRYMLASESSEDKPDPRKALRDVEDRGKRFWTCGASRFHSDSTGYHDSRAIVPSQMESTGPKGPGTVSWVVAY